MIEEKSSCFSFNWLPNFMNKHNFVALIHLKLLAVATRASDSVEPRVKSQALGPESSRLTEGLRQLRLES